MDDLSTFGDIFKGCLEYSEKVLERCVKKKSYLELREMPLYGEGRDCPWT